MDFRKHALILAVVERLCANGSWAGRTHVQKALSLVSEAAGASLPFTFVLYKHGPYSFDLASELQQMKSYGAIVSEARSPFGETIRLGATAAFVKQNGKLEDSELVAIHRVCDFIGTKGVTELEKLATAAWIRSRENIRNTAEVAARLNALKPHVTKESAAQADADLGELLSQV